MRGSAKHRLVLKQMLYNLLGNGGVYTLAQLARSLGVSHFVVYYTLRTTRLDEKCRIFRSKSRGVIMLCGDVEKFVKDYVTAVRTALTDLTAGCKTRCCSVKHDDILRHQAVARLLRRLGYTARSLPARAMSAAIISKHFNHYYASRRLYIRSCK